jgi:hypothetical protein
LWLEFIAENPLNVGRYHNDWALSRVLQGTAAARAASPWTPQFAQYNIACGEETP